MTMIADGHPRPAKTRRSGAEVDRSQRMRNLNSALLEAARSRSEDRRCS